MTRSSRPTVPEGKDMFGGARKAFPVPTRVEAVHLSLAAASPKTGQAASALGYHLGAAAKLLHRLGKTARRTGKDTFHQNRLYPSGSSDVRGAALLSLESSGALERVGPEKKHLRITDEGKELIALMEAQGPSALSDYMEFSHYREAIEKHHGRQSSLPRRYHRRQR